MHKFLAKVNLRVYMTKFSIGATKLFTFWHAEQKLSYNIIFLGDKESISRIPLNGTLHPEFRYLVYEILGDSWKDVKQVLDKQTKNH